ncbi:hypothetical protein DFAR_3700001 [Desulfarculales bacterium]
MARSHLAGVSLQDMQVYLLDHLKIAGVKRNFFLIWPSPPYSRAPAAFSKEPTTWPEAAFIAAAEEQAKVVSPEHVRIAAAELI